MADKYWVLSQRQVTTLKPGGGFENAMEVTFEVIATGTTANVDIPLSRYSADTVSQAIDAYVANIEAVLNL